MKLNKLSNIVGELNLVLYIFTCTNNFLFLFLGQPYNQLAILEAAKGNKLSTIFYYVRATAVKYPFSVASTNMEKLLQKLAKDS